MTVTTLADGGGVLVQENSVAWLLAGTPLPALLGRYRAMLGCGCGCYVGLRVDNHETATATVACSVAHEPMMQRFDANLIASLAEPQDRLLIDVVAELLVAL